MAQSLRIVMQTIDKRQLYLFRRCLTTETRFRLSSVKNLWFGNVGKHIGKVEQARNVRNLSLSGNRCLDVIDRATGIVATFNRHPKRIHRGNPYGRCNGRIVVPHQCLRSWKTIEPPATLWEMFSNPSTLFPEKHHLSR